MTKIAIIFGTRPEYLKLKSIINEIKNVLNYKVIYIQQHKSIDEVIDSCTMLEIHDSNKDRLCSIGEQILNNLPQIIEDCDYIMVQGDTATAYYSALTGFQLQKKIIHIEAGLRTYDLKRPFPEEGYRQMISRITNIHFTPHYDSSILLQNEKVCGKIYNVGNTILDLIHSYNIECSMSNTVLITFHRRENWDKIDILLNGLIKLIKKTPYIKYIWVLHHNPILQSKVKEKIKEFPSIELQNPTNHLNFTKIIAITNFIITDSGGIQEEASFLGKHSIVLRSSTERTHIPKEYITVLEDYSKLDEIYDYIPKNKLIPCYVYGNGNTSKKIINTLKSIV
jgi:UDP-N-acetylglucosamine 2-epimerase (non-hydrolysing)